MPDSFDKLRKAVMTELARQRKAGPSDTPSRAKLLGDFLQACISNLKLSRADFAKKLDIERALADAILDGLLPDSEIDDDFLRDIAQAVEYEPNLLRVMLGRAITPSVREDNV